MFDNIGGKIKGLVKTIFYIEVIASIIAGFSLMATSEYLAFTGLLVIVFGCILAWVSSFFLYGFGQLVENSDLIAEEYRRKNSAHEKTVEKKIERKNTKISKEAKEKIANPEISDDEFIDTICPHCKAELTYTKEQLKNQKDLTCPMCDQPINS